MTSYGSSTDPRSPTYGTATFSTFSHSQTPMSSSRYSHSSSDTPLVSSDSEGATSDRHMRRVNVSPGGSRDSYDTYYEENSLEETAEVEAALNDIDREFESTEDMLTEWSRSTPSTGPTYTGTTPSYSTSLDTYSIYNRDGNRLSTISERTENIPSRPTSYGARVATDGHRHSAHRINTASPSHAHTRSATDFTTDRAPGRRTGDLIAFFEDRASTPESPFGHTRTTSAPGYRSHSPLHVGQSTPYMGGTTSYGTTGYSPRPSSPTKSKAGSTISSASSVSDSLSMSSLLAPPTRDVTTITRTGTQLSPSDFASTFSNTFTASRTASNITSITPTVSSLRRPQTSPRSPLTSVRNIVAAWKERTPSLTKTPQSPTEDSTTSPPSKTGQSRGLERVLSLKRRAERSQRTQNGQSGSGGANNDQRPTTPKSIPSSIIPPPFDMTELGAYARDSREPLRIGVLWYLNVHSGPPYRWQRCEALLYPHMLLLSWIAPGGGRGVVTLDLLNCTEVRSVPSPTHSSAREDVGTIAARTQVAEGHSPNLLELLCPFQLLYGDGVERLAAESARERVRWVSAIWEALDRSVTLPNRSEQGSPTGSIRTIRTIASTTSASESTSGSASTVFVPPLHTIPSLSDLSDSLSTGSFSRAPSYPTHHTRTTDDAAVSNQSYVYPGDPRVIAPSRSSSLRRTSSLTDLDAEFATAVSRARNAKPGLGFGMSLVGGTILGDGSPVTVSSGPRLGRDVRVTPPPSSKTKPRPLSDVSDDAFFSAASKTSSDPRSSFYSLTSRTSSDRDPTTSGLVTDETALEFTSGGSNTQIVASTLSYRRTESNSYLGDSHDGSFACSTCTPTSPSRSSLSRSAEIRRRRYSRCLTCSEETSDKENTMSGYTPSASRSTMSTWTRSCSATPTPAPSTAALSVLDLHDTSGSEGYETAGSPSTASFKSLPTIPSETDYYTAEVCKTEASSEFYTADICKTEASTEFYTAEVCRSEVSTEFVTAEKCKSEAETEFVTAELCKSERSTQFETASVCKTIPSEESTPRSLVVDLPSERAPTPPAKTPSVVPSIVSVSDVQPPVSPTAIPLPPSEFSPTLSSGSREFEPEPPVVIEVTQTEIVSDISATLPTTVSPTSPGESLRTRSVSLTASSDLVVTEVPPTETEFVYSELSPSESDETPSPEPERTPSLHPSLWAPETDVSYSSTHLHPTPFSQSIHLHEEHETSIETSVMRPSPSLMTSRGTLTPITETISTSTPSLPLPPLPHPLPPVLAPSPPPATTPSSGPTSRGILMVSSVSSSLSRTPSTVSSVSSLSSREDDLVSLPDAPPASEISTVPSLLSSRMSSGTLYVRVDPVGVPLPPSPAPSISVSMPTPSTNIPSIHTTLVTEAETEVEVPGIQRTETVTHEIITHEIERLLERIHELDHFRSEESHDIAENVRVIRDELRLLSEYVRNRLATIDRTERVVVTSAGPPPVPHRDQSVGASSVVSEPRITPAGPRERPHLIPVDLSPPLTRTPSITSSASGLSYLSSHHSDDDLLYGEHEIVEGEEFDLPSSLAWTSSSPSSPSSDVTPSLISSSEPSPGPTLSLTSSSLTPIPPPASPTPSSSSSSTARPVESPSFSVLRDMVAHLREQMNALWEGQSTTHQMLDELRQTRPMPQDNTEVLQRLQMIENLIQRVMERVESVTERRTTAETIRERETRRPRVESVSESSTDAESLYRRWSDLLHRPDQTRIHAPTPRHVGPSLDEQLLELLSAPPSQRPAGVQGPPPLTPFMYQPSRRPARSRSASPDLGRSTTAPPFPEPTAFYPEILHDRPVRPTHPRPQYRPPPRPRPPHERSEPPPVVPVVQPPSSRTPRPDHTMGDVPAERVRHVQPAYPVLPPLHDRHERPPTAPATLGGVDDPHASSSWYRRRPHRDATGGIVPPLGGIFPPPLPGAQGPTYVPMPPGPTVVQLPLFDTLMEILREHRLAQLATVDQQRELMRYMRGLNEWLARDVNDRQSELRGVTARIDQLRAELARHGLGGGVIPPMSMPQPQVPPLGPQQGPFVIPPVPQAMPGPPLQPPVVTVNYPHTGVMPPVVPDPVLHVPVVPSPPPVGAVYPSPRWAGGMPEPPVIPTGAPFPEYGPHPPFMDRPVEHDGPFVPHPPSDGTPPPVIVQPPHRRHSHTFAVPHSDGGSPSSGTPTQESFHQHPPVRPIPVPAPPGEYIGPAVSVPPSPRFDHPPAPQNIINVGTQPTPVLPPPGQLQGPSPEPVVAHPPPVMGTIPMRASPPFGPPLSMPGATGPPIVIQPPLQVPQPILPSPVHSRHSPVEFHSPVVPMRHGPEHSPPPLPTQAFQPTHEAPVIMHGSPSIQAYPDPVVVSVPTRRSYDSYYDYPYGRRRPRGYYYDDDDDDDYYPRSRRYRRSRSPYYYEDDPYYRRGYYPDGRRRRRPRDDDDYDEEDDDHRDHEGRRLHRPRPETTTADPSTIPSTSGVQPIPLTGTQRTAADEGVQPAHPLIREGEQPTRLRDEQEEPHPRRRPYEYDEEDRPRGRDEEGEPRTRRRSDEEGEPRTRRRSDEEDGPRARRRSDEESPDAERRRLEREGSRRRRPSDHVYGEEPDDYEDDRRRPTPSIRTPRPDYGDGGPGVPHPYPPQSPVPPTIIRLGGEMDHAPPHIVSVPPSSRSRGHYADRPASPTEYEQEIRRVPPGGTTIPHLPSEGRRTHRHPSSAAGSVAGLPHDMQDPHRAPSRGPTMVEVDTGRPPSEIAHRVPAPPTPEHMFLGPEQTQLVDDLREQHERLNEAERELAQIVHDAHDSEMRREDEFRSNEEARQHTFLDNEAQRDAETRQRSDTLFHELEERVANIPPLPVPPPRDPEQASIIESIRTATQDAASRHAADILETVRMERELLEKEREQNAAERERERAELAAERQRINEEREARVRELEEELDRVRAELDSERQLRMTEADEARQAAAERDEALRSQLAEIANVVNQNHACCEDNKIASEAHWAEKQQWKNERDNQIQELLGIVARIVEEQTAARQREEELRQANEGKPSIEQVLEELGRQNNEQRELLNALSETWRADNDRQHTQLIETVRATANEQVPYNVQGYLDEFSKALAEEVRMLLGEVGKLREERRSIQHELGFLMMMKAKYGPGGEFDPEWRPPMPVPPPDAPMPQPEVPPPPEEPPHARPGWRHVSQRRPTGRIRRPRPEAPLAPEPAPEPRHQSWATWHPNPALAPTPPSIEPTLVVPGTQSPGLFGPRSPRGSLYR